MDKRLVFVTGKGGVGKATVAAALGLAAAKRGKRTIVCEGAARGGWSRPSRAGAGGGGGPPGADVARLPPRGRGLVGDRAGGEPLRDLDRPAAVARGVPGGPDRLA